ncbi:hypothetical protein Tco_0701055 [Tanacetum coccineum]
MTHHKAIALPQYVLSISDHRLIELENQVQRLMEAHLAPTQPTQVNNVTTSYEICSVPHDTQYCMEDPEQAFVEYASSHNNNVGNRKFITNQGPRNFSEAPRQEYKTNFMTGEESEAEKGETMTNITPEHDHNITKEAKNEVKEVMEKMKVK